MFPNPLKCFICKYETFLTHKFNDNLTCPLCNYHHFTEIITNLLTKKEEQYIYFYCKECNILIRYHPDNIHHKISRRNEIYFCELINKYKFLNSPTITGNSCNNCDSDNDNDNNNLYIEDMPIFSNMDKLLVLINNSIIVVKWISFISKEECSVCLDKQTTHTTECCHIVCEICCEQIDNICPICREKQNYLINKFTDVKKYKCINDSEDESNNYNGYNTSDNNDSDDVNNEDDDDDDDNLYYLELNDTYLI